MIKKLLIFLTILLTFITFCFFYKEKLDFSRPINHDKFNAYFASIGAIGTAFSLFLIYQQSRMMAEASRLSVQPDLFLENKSVTLIERLPVDDSDDSSLRLPYLAISNDKEDKYAYYFTVVNAGAEAAKHITFEWDYERNVLEELIKGKYRSPFRPDQKAGMINVIMSNNKWYFPIPRLYLTCCGQKIEHEEIKVTGFDNYGLSVGHTIVNRPMIKLKVSYKGLDNNQYKKIFAVVTNVFNNVVYFKFMEMDNQA